MSAKKSVKRKSTKKKVVKKSTKKKVAKKATKKKLAKKTTKKKVTKKTAKKKAAKKNMKKKVAKKAHSSRASSSFTKSSNKKRTKSISYMFLSNAEKVLLHVKEIAVELESVHELDTWLGLILNGKYEIIERQTLLAFLRQFDVAEFYKIKEDVRKQEGAGRLLEIKGDGRNFFNNGGHEGPDWKKKVICDFLKYCKARKNIAPRPIL